MKEAIIMTKEEYDALQKTIQSLKIDVSNQQGRATYHSLRADALWNALNRPVIEAAAQKHEDEFLDWCAEKSTEYEQREFDEWVEKKGEFYNTSGKVEFADRHCIPATDEAVADRRYQLWIEVQIRNRVPEKTEGWTDLNPYKYGESHILPLARDNAWERYKEHRNITGWCEGPYWDLINSFNDMMREGESVDPDFGGFYR